MEKNLDNFNDFLENFNKEIENKFGDFDNKLEIKYHQYKR